MNRFRKENKSVIFISHDLDEIMEVCDTLTVLRDGKIIRTFEKANLRRSNPRERSEESCKVIIIEVTFRQVHSRKWHWM